jgi:cytochrome c556
MIRVMFVAGALALGVTSVGAQGNIIEQRQGLMKDFNNKSRPIFGALRGQVPFDLEQVQTALRTYTQHAKVLPTLFPESSKSGDTKALPVICENKADFEVRFAKLASDAQAALTSVKDEASFKTEFPKVVQNCNNCHGKFRRPS